MSKSLLLNFRLLHRKIASILFIFFFIIAITGLLLGMKSIFTKTIFENKQKTASITLSKILPLDSLEKIATVFINDKTKNDFKHVERIEVRPSKGIAVAYYKNNFSIQLNATNGIPLLIEQKNSGIIQDIHDGAVLGDLFGNKAGGTSKIIYSLIMGTSLLLLTITGFYMWYKPKQIKNSKNA
jgi:phosphotransferase system  glucose/maltose/N-acetylglucosamine-specific IIC component